MPIQRAMARIGAERLARLAGSLLDASNLCAIATVSSNGRAHVNTAYFAWSERNDLVWLSDTKARHSRNLQTRSTAAVAVYDSHQSWGRPDRGIQLFGTAREAAGAMARDAERLYETRFPAYGPELSYRFYRFRPNQLKLFDEGVLGPGVFVTASVRNGQLSWARTEIYEPVPNG